MGETLPEKDRADIVRILMEDGFSIPAIRELAPNVLRGFLELHPQNVD